MAWHYTLTMVSRPNLLDASHTLMPRLYSTLNTGLPWARKVSLYSCEIDHDENNNNNNNNRTARTEAPCGTG